MLPTGYNGLRPLIFVVFSLLAPSFHVFQNIGAILRYSPELAIGMISFFFFLVLLLFAKLKGGE